MTWLDDLIAGADAARPSLVERADRMLRAVELRDEIADLNESIVRAEQRVLLRYARRTAEEELARLEGPNRGRAPP